jgi:hypothetical protein
MERKDHGTTRSYWLSRSNGSDWINWRYWTSRELKELLVFKGTVESAGKRRN